MEISKFIQDAFKEGSLEKVSKGIEQLVMMMINAIGMIERRELDFEKRLETFEEDLELLKSFLLSKPKSLPEESSPSQKPSKTPSSTQKPVHPSSSTTRSQTEDTPPKQGLNISAHVAAGGPSEEDITAFRKKLLKPTPKHEKPKPRPLSIRAALMNEMKEYFGTAMKKVKKEEEETD